MAELVPQPFSVLLARIVEEERVRGTIFDLPRRSFWRGRDDLDLSVRFHGDCAATAVGPAAGPHSQLAQNVVLAWLAGARIVELKTVQENDRLRIPRPCIDAQNVGYNVEWSQELRLEQSLREYVTAHYLLAILARRHPAGAPAAQLATLLDASVGYDLSGIQSDRVARWIDGLRDARATLADLRASLPPGLRAPADVDVPSRVISCVTLSTFHGCPADEIERIAEHLLQRHAVHVVVKLNPTLLGHDAVEDLLRGRLGYDEIRLRRSAFDQDLRWDDAVAMFGRLATVAARAGLTVGAKFTNTLVVDNHAGRLPGDTMYLSGQPLHVLAMTLADRFVRATGGRFGVSFSGGIDAGNFHEAVACGMAPVTTCTDLLRPGGYGRLPKYLARLEAEMQRAGARDVSGFVLARAGLPVPAGAADPAAVRSAAARNLAAYAARLPDDERYHARKNRHVPRKVGSALELLDCLSCDKCVPVCPNDANFRVDPGKADLEGWDLVAAEGRVEVRPARFVVSEDQQWANYADFCNECGNCDVFCPEDGGPYRVKARFFGSRETFEAAAPEDGILVEDGGGQTVARIGGVVHRLVVRDGGARFGDGLVEATIDAAHRVVEAVSRGAPPGHVLPGWRYHALRLLRDAALAGPNPLWAAMRAAGAPDGSGGGT